MACREIAPVPFASYCVRSHRRSRCMQLGEWAASAGFQVFKGKHQWQGQPLQLCQNRTERVNLSNTEVHAQVWVPSRYHQHKPLRDVSARVYCSLHCYPASNALVYLFPTSSGADRRTMLIAALKSRFRRFRLVVDVFRAHAKVTIYAAFAISILVVYRLCAPCCSGDLSPSSGDPT
jgi:hypothetical protein